MAELVAMSEGCEQQHNAIEKSKIEYTQPAEIQNSRYFLNRPRTQDLGNVWIHEYVEMILL